ncbi:MAG: hypothetical protein M3516_09865 [Actinomycetota bacterium]|nr:hypothetical protein [Actinomycetota bacterium]
MTEDSSDTGVAIEVMITAQVPIPSAYMFRAGGGNRLTRLAGLRPGGDVLRSPCLAYVVRHPSAGRS